MAMSGDGNIPETGMMALCANGGVAQQITGNVLEWDFSNITTGKGVQLDLDGLTTGTGLEIRADSDILTTGKALDIKLGSTMGTSSFSVGDTDTDGFVTITATGASTTATTAALLVKNTNAGTTGAVLRLQHDSASPATNDVLSIIEVYGDNTPGTATEYAKIEFKSIGVTTNVEECDIKFYQLIDGASRNMVNFNATDQNVTINSPLTSSGSKKPMLILTNTSAGTTGSVLRLTHDSLSPATNDVLSIIDVYGDNSAGSATDYANIKFKSTGVTSGSEASEIQFHNRVSDTLTETATIDGTGIKVNLVVIFMVLPLQRMVSF